MADKQLFTNNAVTLLQQSLGQNATQLTVLPGDGNLFPQPSAPGEYFNVTLENQTATVREILKVYGRTGDTFTDIVRGQEGTVAIPWQVGAGHDATLVDHRVTAETMRLAMELPELVAQEDPSVVVPATTTGTTTDVTYSDTQRSIKFWVEMYDPPTGRAQAFEVLALIQGNLSTNTETAIFTRSSRIGYNFPGDILIVLNPTTKVMSLEWINNDPTADLVVTVTRI